MYAHKPTSESLNPVASLTNAEPRIHEPLRPAKDAAIHTRIQGDSKSLPKSDCKGTTIFLVYTCE